MGMEKALEQLRVEVNAPTVDQAVVNQLVLKLFENSYEALEILAELERREAIDNMNLFNVGIKDEITRAQESLDSDEGTA